jgi:uncharacterized protein YdeI (YjbR/CyaY-like superfamily)
MEIGKKLYVAGREEWRSWLEKNHDKEQEIWLVYYHKGSGRPRIPYNDAVEESLCFGWIDSTVKKVDEDSFAQRFTPRRAGSRLSEMNKVRVERLIGAGRMTQSGLEKIKDKMGKSFSIPGDILAELKKDEETWKNFSRFPEQYRRIRVAFIDGVRDRPEEFQRRLRNFLEKTKRNRKFGMVQ